MDYFKRRRLRVGMESLAARELALGLLEPVPDPYASSEEVSVPEQAAQPTPLPMTPDRVMEEAPVFIASDNNSQPEQETPRAHRRALTTALYSWAAQSGFPRLQMCPWAAVLAGAQAWGTFVWGAGIEDLARAWDAVQALEQQPMERSA